MQTTNCNTNNNTCVVPAARSASRYHPLIPNRTCHVNRDTLEGYAYTSPAVQFHPNGVQFGFVWPSARTPHGGASYVW